MYEEDKLAEHNKKGPKGLVVNRDSFLEKGVCPFVRGSVYVRLRFTGELKLEDPNDHEPKKQAWGSYKAVALLRFTATSFAQAGWAHREVRALLSCRLCLFGALSPSRALCVLGVPQKLNDFYDAMLELFHADPSKGNRGPSVDELRNCERAALSRPFGR